jgi:hypothetical protein
MPPGSNGATNMPSGRPRSSRARLVLRIDSGSWPQILAAEREDVEGVELHLVIVPRECSALKSDTPSTPSTTASPSMTNCCSRFFSAASTIQGKRLVQSWPLRVISRTALPWRSTRRR